MNIVEILIWESTNALLLIPVVIGIVMLTRWWIRRRPAFTERDWLFCSAIRVKSSLASSGFLLLENKLAVLAVVSPSCPRVNRNNRPHQ
jgi:hypothetical protein